MPYIVTTTRRMSCTCWGTVGEDESGMCAACHAGGQHITRRAFPTLAEAKTSCVGKIAKCAFDANTIDGYQPHEDRARALSERGGKVGPLPDGTTIEIERVPVHGLARRAKHDRLLARALAAGDSPADSLTRECVAAFNAKQAA